MEDPPTSFAQLRVEYWPIERLKPYERNPRTGDKRAWNISEPYEALSERRNPRSTQPRANSLPITVRRPLGPALPVVLNGVLISAARACRTE